VVHRVRLVGQTNLGRLIGTFNGPYALEITSPFACMITNLRIRANDSLL
jgi:hypothetical protein